MDKKLLEILACPICKGKLVYKQSDQTLICKHDKLAFPIRRGIPVMLEDQAEQIKEEEDQ